MTAVMVRLTVERSADWAARWSWELREAEYTNRWLRVQGGYAICRWLCLWSGKRALRKYLRENDPKRQEALKAKVARSRTVIEAEVPYV